MAPNGTSNGLQSTTNYVAYRDPKALNQPRIGSLDLQTSQIQPLSFQSGTLLSDLYQVIEIGDDQIKSYGERIPLASVELLPPIYGRDVLAVGKNYHAHAKEFNSSGYDSSDKVDIPTHPVIFTKRATSIIASGKPIFPHPGFTESPDYEGEIGVIIGKSGFRISEADAMDYVWGYTIINDMTARERQRDHKQFYIGKSPDTFCPMGPIAVPASKLPKNLQIRTKVNGEERQSAAIDDLIFSIPFLIKTLSEGQTILPGDVIATGTPAGVGIGKKPPVFLKPGDVIEVSVTGLGTLTNQIAELSAQVDKPLQETHIPNSNLNKTCGGLGLTSVNEKLLYFRQIGTPGQTPIIFIHGLGGSSEYFGPLISALSLTDTHSILLLDLEGHGLSPTSAASTISISSYADDVASIAELSKVTGAVVIAHSMGCLVASDLAIKHPELVSKLILLGPPPSPVPDAGRAGSTARAVAARSSGMSGIVDAVVSAGTSSRSKAENPIAIAAIRLSLLAQDAEGYAKGCTALAGSSKALPLQHIKAPTLIVTGDEDKVSPTIVCEGIAREIGHANVEVLPAVGHWHIFEDIKGVANAVKRFL
ncbi:hypothetical protein BP6252_10879 [Coleophoma cylindrospora]|uniref:Fumarylacetoacetate hydrolase-like protein n=1 Tax=Coleophoma cylindrospora TaxID=1849047 RepID=A0A3D8QPF9_9HELO|nr:hypothetical protein BP6252_10879 [Coleophoma cylindrospora]